MKTERNQEVFNGYRRKHIANKKIDRNIRYDEIINKIIKIGKKNRYGKIIKKVYFDEQFKIEFKNHKFIIAEINQQVEYYKKFIEENKLRFRLHNFKTINRFMED